ncbi:hypothetical protein ABPG74_017462 [Tetrahymena malaccensis]
MEKNLEQNQEMEVEITADKAISIIDSILNPPEPNEVETLIKKLKDAEAINDSEYKQSEEGELVYIDIYGKNQLSDDHYNSILKALDASKKCYHLTLDFTNCQFAKKITEVLSVVSNMKQLRFLEAEFNQNNIDSIICQQMSQSLKLNKNLQTLKLKLKHNQIKEQGLISLADAISELKQLQTVDIKLYENQIANGMSYLIEKLSHITTLTDLTLFFSKNDLQDQQAQEIGAALGKLTSVNKLFIYSGYKEIINQIYSIKLEVKSIKLKQNRWNQIGSDGLKQIAQGIQKIPDLKSLKLYLSSNQITSVGFLHLLQNINQCRQLAYLEISLSGNKLNSEHVELNKNQFVSAFRDFNNNLKNLKHFILYLRKNDLKSSFNSLFSILKQNKNLHHLILDYSFNNQILPDRKKVEFMMKKIVRLTSVIVHLDPVN